MDLVYYIERPGHNTYLVLVICKWRVYRTITRRNVQLLTEPLNDYQQVMRQFKDPLRGICMLLDCSRGQ